MFFSQRGSCWRSTFSDFLASWMMLNNLNHEKHWVCIFIYIHIHIGHLVDVPKSIQNSDIQNDDWNSQVWVVQYSGSRMAERLVWIVWDSDTPLYL
jgi:hypothetical protein